MTLAIEFNQGKRIWNKETKEIPEYAITHEKLGTIDDEPWDVTKEEDDNNAYEDNGKIHLVMCRAVPTGFDMCESVKGIIHSVDNECIVLPDCLEDSGVEISQKCNR